MKVKLVFSNGEGDERELGPFNQGVVLKHDRHLLTVIDVASSQPIAHWQLDVGWSIERLEDKVRDLVYAQMFVQNWETIWPETEALARVIGGTD